MMTVVIESDYVMYLSALNMRYDWFFPVLRVFPFLSRDATQSAVMPQYVVCPSVTLMYVFHIRWNTSKITSRSNSLRHLLTLTPATAIWCNGKTPKIRVKSGWVRSTKNLQYLRNGAR